MAAYDDRLIRIFAFAAMALVTLVVVAVVTIPLLVGMKEGFSSGDLPYLAGGALVLALLGYAWWPASGRSWKWALPGWIVLSAPFLIVLSAAAALVVARLQGERLAGSAEIVGYEETAIAWPGFDGPVGLRLVLTLEHRTPPRGVLAPPEVRMGPAVEVALGDAASTLTSGAGFFKAAYDAPPVPPLTLLKTVLFRGNRANPDWAARLAESGHSRVTFELYPGNLATLDGPSKLCLGDVTPGLPVCTKGTDPTTGCLPHGNRRQQDPVYRQGSDLSALWYFFGGSDMVADLGPKLTDALRRQSFLQGDGDAWTALQKRLQPASLVAAGYRLCPPGPESHTAFRICYCRSP